MRGAFERLSHRRRLGLFARPGIEKNIGVLFVAQRAADPAYLLPGHVFAGLWAVENGEVRLRQPGAEGDLDMAPLWPGYGNALKSVRHREVCLNALRNALVHVPT
jgi:hypothetical protein